MLRVFGDLGLDKDLGDEPASTNTGISPLRRQGAPPLVEMTCVFCWFGTDKD
jgi:hypothetical protein